MPRSWIEDLDDPRLAIYRHLKATNLTRRSPQFVVEGPKLLDRLRASRFPLASVLVTDRHEARVAPRVPPGVPLYVVPHDRIAALVGFRFHQGVLACGLRRPPPGLAEIVGAAERLTVVVCPRLTNPENLGAIVRIGDVFGIDAVLVGPRCPDPLSRRVLRVSMGTALRLPVIASADLERDVERLRSEWGVELAAAVADPAAEPFEAVRRPARVALLLGDEDEGLTPEWIARCDRRITIPMRPGADSLNVAVAAGILLHHVTVRQPGASAPLAPRGEGRGEGHDTGAGDGAFTLPLSRGERGPDWDVSAVAQQVDQRQEIVERMGDDHHQQIAAGQPDAAEVDADQPRQDGVRRRDRVQQAEQHAGDRQGRPGAHPAAERRLEDAPE
jgi:tRNA G18 (ribose-2'-O)-methylase SpoU